MHTQLAHQPELCYGSQYNHFCAFEPQIVFSHPFIMILVNMMPQLQMQKPSPQNNNRRPEEDPSNFSIEFPS